MTLGNKNRLGLPSLKATLIVVAVFMPMIIYINYDMLSHACNDLADDVVRSDPSILGMLNGQGELRIQDAFYINSPDYVDDVVYLYAGIFSGERVELSLRIWGDCAAQKYNYEVSF